MEHPIKSTRRPVADLAEPLGVTKAAIYRGCHEGHIPFIYAGVKMMITDEAFDYHVENGYGPRVKPYGTADAA